MKARILILIINITLVAAAAMAHGGEQHILGTVITVTDKSITVKTTAKEPVTVSIGAATKFIRRKTPAKVTDLRVGDRVVIHATEGANEQFIADTVEFVTPKPTAPATAPAKKGS